MHTPAKVYYIIFLFKKLYGILSVSSAYRLPHGFPSGVVVDDLLYDIHHKKKKNKQK